MPTKDTSEIKENIIFFIRRNGPSLPVHVAKEIGQSMLFTSAFLSELLSEKKLKTSNMKVGNSPLYLISGQEFQLEKFSHYLKSKEKEAYELLKEKRFLRDGDQVPAIRVALRAIKDFAIPFKKNEDYYFRYLTASEDELPVHKKQREEFNEEKNQESQEVKKEESHEKKEFQVQKEEIKPEKEDRRELEIFDKKKNLPKKKSSQKATKKPSKKTKQVNEKFFNKIKNYLNEKGFEILDIVGFSKNDLTLKVKRDDKEKVLVAYNKKSIREEDIVKAYKQSEEFGLNYLVLSFGEPLKKLDYFISAIQSLEKIEKVKEDKN